MPQIEDRLRDALATLANEVPPSPHARDRLYRRIGTRRRPPNSVLATAAAVAVMAAISVPIALAGGDESGTTTATTTTATATAPVTPENGEVLFPVGGGGMGPKAWGLDLVKNVETGQYCLVLRSGDTWQGEPTCIESPTFSGGQAVEIIDLVEVTKDMDLPPVVRSSLERNILFFTRPEVASLTVRSSDLQEWASSTISSRAGEKYAIFLASFNGTHEHFGFRAKNRGGQVIEEGGG
jgi:hypothetical protein